MKRSCIGPLVCATVLCGSAPGQGHAQQPPTLHSGATLVQVTIVARDRKGTFASGLTANDFVITEDRKPVTPVFFREVTSPSTLAAPAGVPAAPFSNAAGGTPSSVTVVLLDRLNTKWEDQARARDQLKLFFAQLRPDDRVAVYALDGTALRVLHDFTSDASALLRAVDPSAHLTAAHIDAASDPATSPGILQLMRAVAANTTVVALQTVGQHLAAIPGRKNVVWVSSGFQIGNSTLGVSPTEGMQRMVRALNTANISVYSLDPTGLPGAFSSVTATTTTFATNGGIAANRDILESLSELTGGRAFLNKNDIAASVRQALDDAARHYELQYESPAPANNDRYREIRVTSPKSGLDLQYRHGYYATAAQAPDGDRKSTLERTLANPLDATGIPLDVTPTPRPNGLELAIHAQAEHLGLVNTAGVWSDALDLAIGQLREDGTSTMDVDTTIALTLNDAQHQTVLSDGLTVTKTIVVDPDTSRVVVVVRDSATGAVGSVVMPAAKLARQSQ